MRTVWAKAWEPEGTWAGMCSGEVVMMVDALGGALNALWEPQPHQPILQMGKGEAVSTKASPSLLDSRLSPKRCRSQRWGEEAAQNPR